MSMGPRRGCGGDVVWRCAASVREDVSWILTPTKLQPRDPGVIQGRSGALGWIGPSKGPGCAPQKLDRQFWVRVAHSGLQAASSLMLRRDCVSAADTLGAGDVIVDPVSVVGGVVLDFLIS